MNSPPAFNTTRWSTQDVAPQDRFDYYANALSSALSPMSVERPAMQDFSSEMLLSDLGSMALVRQTGTAHRCFAGQHNLKRNEEHSYHLLINVRSDWNIEHLGGHRMAPGELILVDSNIPWDIQIASSYEFVHLKLNELWMRQWLVRPNALAGRRIAMDSAWGRALAAFISPLSHDFLHRSPLPVSLIVEHIGSLLALAAQDMRLPAAPGPSRRSEQALLERIKDNMRQQCVSPMLTAPEVAAAVGVSLRTFHRCFQRAGETFANTLTQMRCTQAMRMLESPLFKRVSVGEIARRAGFCDASHFSRVIRSRTGRTPRQIRGGNVTTQPDMEEEDIPEERS